MGFKRTPKGSKPAHKTSKHKSDKFRDTLDGSFESLRQAQAMKKLDKSSRPGSAGVAKNRNQGGKSRQLKKADLDDSISKLADLMK
jgi:hypothetical protein